ncbi:hypothetical protein C8J57DRAFT_267164 [Mycena rebaudengoi]|nr:hypothetical protein C8J57DRAFT_267164 [Mycena rebaudengoi]
MDELILKFPKSFHLQYAQDMSATDRARLKEPRTKLGVWSEKDTSVVERGVMLYEELWGCNRQQTMASVTNWLKKEPYKRSDPPDNSDGILLLLGIIETQLNLNAHDCALAIVAACSHREPSPSIAPVVGRVPTSHDFRPGGPLCSILERCIVVTQNVRVVLCTSKTVQLSLFQQYGIPDSKAVKYLQGFASQTADVFWSALHAATIIQGGLTGFAKINRFKKLVYAAMQPQASANTPTASMSTVQSWTNAYGWRPSLFAYWGNLTLSEVEAMSVSPILTKQHLRLLSTS